MNHNTTTLILTIITIMSKPDDPMDLLLSRGSRGPNCGALKRGEDPQDITIQLPTDSTNSEYRTLEDIAMVGLLLANAAAGKDKNLCFVNAVLQILRFLKNFR